MRVSLVLAAAALLAAGIVFSQQHGGSADELGSLALGLTIVLAAALIGGHLAGRFGQPAVLGELVVGVVVGNLPGLERLHFIGTDPYLDMLARIGMLLLMFEVGIDLSVRDLFAVGRSALQVAVLGTIASFAFGTAAARLLLPASPLASQVFLGAAITATSVGITARVLKDMRASRSLEARIILGAAVVDDVLALVVLGVVVAWVAPGQGDAVSGTAVAGMVMKTIGFLALAIALGVSLTPAWFRQAARLESKGALLVSGLGFCFLLSWAASAIGLAALVGAFAAGLVLEDAHSALFVERGERPLSELLQPMTALLVPIFFVLTGFRVDLPSLLHPDALALSAALIIAAIAGKLACSLGVAGRGARRIAVATGMIPRGEVALIFAALAGTVKVGAAPIVDPSGYTAIVTVVIVTTLLTPPLLKWRLA